MGGVTSRISFNGIHRSRGGSQPNEPLYSYSLNKNYFCNYFLMGGERFEVNDPDYLFGDSCDLNFLSCTKPFSLPYKKAQQSLLSNLNTKHKVGNKVSNRVGVSLASPLQILTGRHRRITQCCKQDAQTQTLNESDKSNTIGTEPSQPLIMHINIRKETLRLVRSTNFYNIDSDLNSLSQNQSPIQTASTSPDLTNNNNNNDRQLRKSLTGPSPSKKNKPSRQVANTPSRHSTNSSQTTTTATIHMDDSDINHKNPPRVQSSPRATSDKKKGNQYSDTTSDISSPISTNPSAGDADSSSSGAESSKSGYTSVKDVSPYCAASSDDDENFVDALNDTSNLSSCRDEADDKESERDQQRKSLLSNTMITKENREVMISITGSSSEENLDVGSDDRELVRITNLSHKHNDGRTGVMYMKRQSGKSIRKEQAANRNQNQTTGKRLSSDDQLLVNRVYNIEFQFDTEVDCSIRIFYFCTREVNSNGVTYKPQHATYKSKAYIYKKGLNQKFEQQEHTFQPHLFDEDLLIYKPLDLEGNYNSGAVFPIVIHCVALDGPQPRQSQSLIATVEKSQLDESYSIKPLKQLIFVDGVQYILQDIYGIENKHFHQPKLVEVSQSNNSKQQAKNEKSKSLERSMNINPSLRSSMISIGNNDLHHLSDTASIASGLIIDGCALRIYDDDDKSEGDLANVVDRDGDVVDHRASLASVASVNNQQQQFRSLQSENISFECVICMSEERDTMLLPCRHLCLCSSCAQSLRYQANSCPICRRPFKAALNLRIIQSRNNKLRRRNRYRSCASEHLLYGGTQE